MKHTLLGLKTVSAVSILGASLLVGGCGNSSNQAASEGTSSSGTGSTSGNSAASGDSSAVGATAGSCKYLTAADFQAIGATLKSQPIYNHQSAVQDQNCFYDLGSTDDTAYLDMFDTASAGQQYYTNGTDPSAGNGNPVAVTGVGDSAYWLAAGDTLFGKKGSTVFQLKLQETGKSPTQLQADATTLGTKIAGRIS